MAADIQEKLAELLDKLQLIKAEEIPGIDLYMDQVTTFMESHLGNLKRNPQDKVLTKTMINNYAKNDLLPPPEKKKYSRNHVFLLTFIYYLKNVLSISDIKTLLGNLTQNHFEDDSALNLKEIYKEVIKYQPEVVEMVQKDLKEKAVLVQDAFEGEKDEEYLKTFFLLCLLGFDVYLKKTLIEAVIDDIADKKQSEEMESAKAVKEKAAKEKTAKEKTVKEKAVKEKNVKEK